MKNFLDEKLFTKFLNQTDIESIVTSLANQINRDYENKRVVIVAVLKGSCVLVGDLSKKLKIDCEIDFVRLTNHISEDGKLKSSGTITIVKDLSTDVKGKHVIILEEIIDSGRKLKFLYDRIKTAGPESVEVMTFLDKQGKRLVDVPVKYIGKVIYDQFLVGYGLDLEEKCRNLPEIYTLKYPN
jgi:hypoxanthine phosphoribosyltransferase